MMQRVGRGDIRPATACQCLLWLMRRGEDSEAGDLVQTGGIIQRAGKVERKEERGRVCDNNAS